MANEKFLSSVGLTHLWSELKKKFVLNVSNTPSEEVTIGKLDGTGFDGFNWDGQSYTSIRNGGASVICNGSAGTLSLRSGGKTVELTATGMANLLKCLNGDYNVKSTDKIAVGE